MKGRQIGQMIPPAPQSSKLPLMGIGFPLPSVAVAVNVPETTDGAGAASRTISTLLKAEEAPVPSMYVPVYIPLGCVEVDLCVRTMHGAVFVATHALNVYSKYCLHP